MNLLQKIEEIISDIVNKGLMDEKDTATIIHEQAISLAEWIKGSRPQKKYVSDIVQETGVGYSAGTYTLMSQQWNACLTEWSRNLGLEEIISVV